MTTQECIEIWKQAVKLANDDNTNLSDSEHRVTVPNPWHSRCAIEAGVFNKLVPTGKRSTSRFYQKSVADKFYELLHSAAQK
jgi:hypothetical protein